MNGQTPTGLAPIAAPDSEGERLLPVFIAAGLIDRGFVEKPVEIEGRAAAEPAFVYMPTERTLRRLATV